MANWLYEGEPAPYDIDLDKCPENDSEEAWDLHIIKEEPMPTEKAQMIEYGKLTAQIKDFNIMGNGPKMLSNITMVANDLKLYNGGTGICGKGGQILPVSYGLPTCLVKSMTVGGLT